MHFFCLKCFFPRCMDVLVPCCMLCFSEFGATKMFFASEADPTNREIAKELQVCLDRSAAGGEAALEYRNHAFQDERSLHSERRFFHGFLGGDLKYISNIFLFSSLYFLGNDSIWRTFFPNGLVETTTYRFTIITTVVVTSQVCRGDLWRSRNLWWEVPACQLEHDTTRHDTDDDTPKWTPWLWNYLFYMYHKFEPKCRYNFPYMEHIYIYIHVY